jgi:hypothetical protein
MEHLLETVFGDSERVRLTLFLPDPEASSRLMAAARIGWGRPSAESRIQIRLGQGLAGIAWDKPGSILFATLGPYDGDRDRFEDIATRLLRLPAEEAAGLSDAQMETRAMLAISLMDVGHLFRGVLMIDCKDVECVREKDPAFWLSLSNSARQLVQALPAPRYVGLELKGDDISEPNGVLKELKLSEKMVAA